jgi:hypothetical protein
MKVFFLRGDPARGFKTLDTKDVQNLVKRKSNIYNERILNSFFYKKTIVCEGEDDRVIYEHASADYLWEDFQDINFIGLSNNGKPGAIDLFEKLTELGLNARVILDFDFILTNFDSFFAKHGLSSNVSSLRNEIATIKTNQPNIHKILKNGGLLTLKKYSINAYNLAVSALKDLESKNIFVVPVGELESWTGKVSLADQLSEVQRKKKRKLRLFLEKVIT